MVQTVGERVPHLQDVLCYFHELRLLHSEILGQCDRVLLHEPQLVLDIVHAGRFLALMSADVYSGPVMSDVPSQLVLEVFLGNGYERVEGMAELVPEVVLVVLQGSEEWVLEEGGGVTFS